VFLDCLRDFQEVGRHPTKRNGITARCAEMRIDSHHLHDCIAGDKGMVPETLAVFDH
jgi:hypothetical protein